MKIGAASGVRLCAVLPGADDQIGAAVAIDIASDGLAGAESFAGRFAGEREKLAAFFSGVEIDAAGAGSLSAVRKIGCEDVGESVAIEIAGDGKKHRAECLAGGLGVE